MQVKPMRWPGLAALVLATLMAAGCGQKGPLYREAPVPAADADIKAEQKDNGSER
jgi:predicted small lipoprotein YifL